MILVAAMVILGAVVPAVSAGSQTWYLTSEAKTCDAPKASDGLIHAKDNLMHKGEWAGDGTRFELSSEKPAAWFYADTDAEGDLGFGEHSWKAYIRTEKIDGGEIGTHLKVSVCKLDGAGNPTISAEKTIELTETTETPSLWHITCADIDETTQDFSIGDWLAVRLYWTDAPTEEKLYIYYKPATGYDSYIQSPPSDPGYPASEIPIPEFTTIATPIAIVLGLIFLFHRRKQKS